MVTHSSSSSSSSNSNYRDKKCRQCTFTITTKILFRCLSTSVLQMLKGWKLRRQAQVTVLKWTWSDSNREIHLINPKMVFLPLPLLPSVLCSWAKTKGKNQLGTNPRWTNLCHLISIARHRCPPNNLRWACTMFPQFRAIEVPQLVINHLNRSSWSQKCLMPRSLTFNLLSKFIQNSKCSSNNKYNSNSKALILKILLTTRLNPTLNRGLGMLLRASIFTRNNRMRFTMKSHSVKLRLRK